MLYFLWFVAIIFFNFFAVFDGTDALVLEKQLILITCNNKFDGGKKTKIALPAIVILMLLYPGVKSDRKQITLVSVAQRELEKNVFVIL